MAKPKSLVDEKKMIEENGEDLGNFKSLAQKRASQKNGKKMITGKKTIGKIKTKLAVKEFLKCQNLKQTAKAIGLSETQTSSYLKSPEADKLFKEVFAEIGVDKATLSEIAFNDFLEYNRQKVKKTDDKGRVVEEMRDGRLAFKSLQFIADKLESSKQEIEINQNININNNTASLAVKQLIKQVDEIELLEELAELVSQRLHQIRSNNAKVINVDQVN